MSRRHKRRRRHGQGRCIDNTPRPPKKKIRFMDRRPRDALVNTEVHDAIMSLGADDRTGRLSDAEFNRQVAGEIGYLFKKSGSHFRNACRSISELIDILF